MLHSTQLTVTSLPLSRLHRGSWSAEEDLELLKLAHEMGKKWSIIAKKLRGRTENAVKNRFHAIFRKHLEKKNEENASDSRGGQPNGLDEEYFQENEEEPSSGSGGINKQPQQQQQPSNLSPQIDGVGSSSIRMNERQLIKKLIKSIEEDLKINTSECQSSGDNNSPNNSVNSAESTGRRGRSNSNSSSSKVASKQKNKMMKFYTKTYESSLSSDDESSRNSPQPSPSFLTKQSIPLLPSHAPR